MLFVRTATIVFRIAIWQVDAAVNPTEAPRGSIVILGGELLGFVEGPDHCSSDFVASTKTPCSIGSGTAYFAKNLPDNGMSGHGPFSAVE